MAVFACADVWNFVSNSSETLMRTSKIHISTKMSAQSWI